MQLLNCETGIVSMGCLNDWAMRAIRLTDPETAHRLAIRALIPDYPYGCGLYPVRSLVNLLESVS